MNSLELSFPATVDALLAELNSTRQTLLNELSQAHKEPPAERWSCEQIAHHLYLTEKSIARGFSKFFTAPERFAQIERKELEEIWNRMIAGLNDRSKKLSAPERIASAEPPPLAETIALLGESRAALLAAIDGKSYEELAAIGWQHPFFGFLRGTSWLSMIAHHELRHCEQAKELRS